MIWLAALNEWVNAILKWIARDDRPYWWFSPTCNFSGQHLKQYHITCESGPGFPSGHVMSASSLGFILLVSLYKLMETRTAKTLYLVTAIPLYTVFVVLVAISRVFIAAHFPHQVLVGVLGGVAIALIVHLFTVRSPSSLLNRKAAFVAGSLLCIALTLFYILGKLNLNPLSSIDFALRYCKNQQWVHVDTTLFFAVVRDVGSLLGISFAAMILRKFDADMMPHAKFSLNMAITFARFVLGVFFCFIINIGEKFRLPHENLLAFYFIATWKYAFIILLVILGEYNFRKNFCKTKTN